MGFQDSSWNISASSFVINECIGFCDIMQKNSQTRTHGAGGENKTLQLMSTLVDCSRCQLTESSVARRHLYRLRTSCCTAEPADALSTCRLMCLLYVTRSCNVHVISRWSTCVTNASHFWSSINTSSICTKHKAHTALQTGYAKHRPVTLQLYSPADCSDATLASFLTNILPSLTKWHLSPKHVSVTITFVSFAVSGLISIHQLPVPLLSLSFTPNLITVILSTINSLSLNYPVSSRSRTLLLVLSLKLLSPAISLPS